MRKLARRLGVEAMSLYNHVANKDEILDGLADAVVDEIEHPTDAPDWKAAIRRNATSTRDVFVRHRWASGLWMSRQGSGPARMRHGDWILRTLRAGGLPPDVTYHAFHLFEAYVLGYAALQLSVPYEGEELAGMARRFLERFPADEFPDLAEHIRQHVEPHHGDRGGFELGLDLILDGLEQLRDAG